MAKAGVGIIQALVAANSIVGIFFVVFSLCPPIPKAIKVEQVILCQAKNVLQSKEGHSSHTLWQFNVYRPRSKSSSLPEVPRTVSGSTKRFCGRQSLGAKSFSRTRP